MIYEVNTGKSIKDLRQCDYCKYNCGYSVRNKNMIDCVKFDMLVENLKDAKCEYNEFQNQNKKR